MTGIIFIFLRGENDNSFGIVKILGRVLPYLPYLPDPSILGCGGGATEKSRTFFLKAEIFPALFSYIRVKSEIREELIMSENYELVKFVDGSFELEVNVSPEEDTVWLTQQQMVLLFHTSRSNIVEHIRNIYAENELDESSTCRIIRQV